MSPESGNKATMKIQTANGHKSSNFVNCKLFFGKNTLVDFVNESAINPPVIEQKAAMKNIFRMH